MHNASGSNVQKSQRRCRHAPHNAATEPATCCDGNAAPRTRPKCSIKLTVAVNGPPCKSPCHIPAIANHGLSIGKNIAMQYPTTYPAAEYVIVAQYASQSRRQYRTPPTISRYVKYVR